MTRLQIYLTSFLIALLLGGCTLAKISGRSSTPLFLNNPPANVEVIRQIDENKLVTFDYTGAFDVSEVIGDALNSSDADAVTNLVITVKSDFATFFINLFTLGIANARRFQVSGDLVRTPEGLGYLLDGGAVLDEAPDLSELDTYLSDFADRSQSPVIARTETGYALVR